MHTELSNRSYFTDVEQAEVLKRWILFHGSENQMQLEWKGKTAEVEKMCRFNDAAARHAMFCSAGSRPPLRLLLLYRASSRPADSPCADLSRDVQPCCGSSGAYPREMFDPGRAYDGHISFNAIRPRQIRNLQGRHTSGSSFRQSGSGIPRSDSGRLDVRQGIGMRPHVDQRSGG